MDTGKSMIAVVVAILVALSGTTIVAQERDSDGTRMQARHVEVGSQHADRLDPPRQNADWRLIQLREEHDLSLELTVEPPQREATLTLTGSTGEQLQSETTAQGVASIDLSVEAGIYYIAVECDRAIEYELSIE